VGGSRRVTAEWTNLVSMFFDQAQRLGERPFLWRKRDGRFTPQTWREIAARTTALARGLQLLDVNPGDRVVIVSENRPAWPIADLAIMATGGVTVPAYTTNTVADQRHILIDSGAVGAVVSNRRLAKTLLNAAVEAPALRFVICIEPPEMEAPNEIVMVSWADVIARGDANHTNIVAQAADIESDSLACLIYTSGTGGTPKGVMLHHGAILHNCVAAAAVLNEFDLNERVFLSFLPLSHAYEHTTGQFLPIALGGEIYYAEGIEKLASNLLEARPTILAAVPRFYELLHQRIVKEVRRAGGYRERLFEMALAIGRRRLDDNAGGLSLPQRLIDPLLDRLVRSRVQQRFGGRVKAMVAGGAPLSPEVGSFFTALGLPVFQGYGQTEAGPLISVNRRSNNAIGTVGPPLDGVTVRIADDGEILVQGPNVMKGYWRNDEATAAAIVDGWLHTGDIGEIDSRGRIRITDRKKDLIVVSGGDNVSPSRIESLLTLRPEISQAMVIGDKRPHLVALLVPDAEWLRTWAKDAGKSPDMKALANDVELKKVLANLVEGVNRELSVIERVRRFAIPPEPFTIDNGMLTPTLKIRRHAVRGGYADLIDSLYE
jgi:long-chain acyl-CoA synthetase